MERTAASEINELRQAYSLECLRRDEFRQRAEKAEAACAEMRAILIGTRRTLAETREAWRATGTPVGDLWQAGIIALNRPIDEETGRGWIPPHVGWKLVEAMRQLRRLTIIDSQTVAAVADPVLAAAEPYTKENE